MWMVITPVAESKEELKSLLMRVKEESERTGLKLKIKKTKIRASGPLTSWQIEGDKMEAVTDFLFLGFLLASCLHLASWQERYDKHRQCVENQRHYSADKGPYSQGYGLPSSHIWLWKLDCKEGRVPKNWCFQTMVLEKPPESPLDIKEIKAVNLKGNQPWILVRRTDAEVETPVLWSSDANSWLIGKVPDAGKDWGRKEKRASEDELAGYHHRSNGHELGQGLGDAEGQRGLACCSPWGHKESDMAGQLNNKSNFLAI